VTDDRVLVVRRDMSTLFFPRFTIFSLLRLLRPRLGFRLLVSLCVRETAANMCALGSSGRGLASGESYTQEHTSSSAQTSTVEFSGHSVLVDRSGAACNLSRSRLHRYIEMLIAIPTSGYLRLYR